MPVYCFFDKDFDKRLGCHVDPSRTTVMEDPFRSYLVNPHLYTATKYNYDEAVRQEPEIQNLRTKIEHICDSTVSTLRLMKSMIFSKKFGHKPLHIGLDVESLALIRDPRVIRADASFKDGEGIPALLDQEGKPTPAFCMLLDRIAECAELEKEQAREVGRREGLMAGINLMNEKVQHPEMDLKEEIYKVSYPDYSDKYTGPRVMNMQIGKEENERAFALQKLSAVWKHEDQQQR